jgi:hydrogenase/urease accessory protein HupE
MIEYSNNFEQHLTMRPKSSQIGLFLCLGAILFALSSSLALAHEVRPAYLELHQTGTETYAVLWKVPARGENLRLGIYVEFPSGTTNVTAPRTSTVDNASTERWSVKRTGGLTGSKIYIAGLAATMTDVLARIENLDGTTQVARLTPSSPSFVVAAAPGALEVARTYLVLGIEHILFGIDHLLFVLALLIIVRGWRKLVGTITAFTIAHSITLAAATLGFVHVSGKPVEATIALSIVFVACEIVHRRQGRSGLTEAWPWMVAFTFGLLHGLGFAGALREVGLPQNAIPLALLFFNVGVEVGQIAFISVVLVFIRMVRRLLRRAPRWAELIPPYAIGSVAMFWVMQRVAAF